MTHLLSYRFLGSAIPMFLNLALVSYTCRRFLRALRLRRRIVAEMEEFNESVLRARKTVDYIGAEVAKGMEEIKEDVGKELRVTDRLTRLTSEVTPMLRRFSTLEDNLIELVRMHRDTESVRIGTPTDVGEEVRRILQAAKLSRVKGTETGTSRRGEKPVEDGESVSRNEGPEERRTPRNPLSKFSTFGTSARKPTLERSRVSAAR